MRVILNIVGVLMMLMGAIWFLQGINILPGSFMIGQVRWAVYGGGTALVGLGHRRTGSQLQSQGELVVRIVRLAGAGIRVGTARLAGEMKF
jgi:hypothetical protein